MYAFLVFPGGCIRGSGVHLYDHEHFLHHPRLGFRRAPEWGRALVMQLAAAANQETLQHTNPPHLPNHPQGSLRESDWRWSKAITTKYNFNNRPHQHLQKNGQTNLTHFSAGRWLSHQTLWGRGASLFSEATCLCYETLTCYYVGCEVLRENQCNSGKLKRQTFTLHNTQICVYKKNLCGGHRTWA